MVGEIMPSDSSIYNNWLHLMDCYNNDFRFKNKDIYPPIDIYDMENLTDFKNTLLLYANIKYKKKFIVFD